LDRYGLPQWRDEGELAAALGLSIRRLRYYSIHRQRERVCHYVTFAVPKRTGGERLIMAPKTELKALQRKLHRLLVQKLPVSEQAHGFRCQRSICTNARPHVGQRVVLKMDLKNFFPSVHMGRVRGLLIAYGYSYPVAATLAVLMTEAERQPVEENGVIFHVPVGPRYCVQGAPTSPGLCNAVLLTLDHRLTGLARHFGWVYSRYADDLTFSGGDVHQGPGLLRIAGRIIAAEGFHVNAGKTRLMRSGSRQTVTGLVVNRELGLPRQERRRLRAALHRQRLRHEAPDARLLGKLAYLHMVNPRQAEALGRAYLK
jgi:retron-type reverse transcriptase